MEELITIPDEFSDLFWKTVYFEHISGTDIKTKYSLTEEGFNYLIETYKDYQPSLAKVSDVTFN